MRLPIILLVLFLTFTLACAGEEIVPREFQYDGKVFRSYSYGVAANTVYADLEGNSKEEIVSSFQAQDRKGNTMAFAAVSWPNYTRIIPLYERSGKIEAVDLDNDGKKELVFYSSGGIKYTKIYVYKYENEAFHKLFENGSGLPVGFKVKDNIPTIRIGRADWEHEGSRETLWEVYQWNGSAFEYKPALSTSKQIAEEEETRRYIERFRKAVKGN